MEIPVNKIQKNLFTQRPARTNATQAVQHNYRSSINTITPQNYNSGAISQLINSKYLFELKKEAKKVLRGKKLQEILNRDYSVEEFENLPNSLKNLISFDRSISTAEILQFMEAIDKSHEITFRDYNFDRIKFRALFAALGELIDVEMQAGPSTFVPLSDNFEIKKKVKEVFANFKQNLSAKLKARLRLRSQQKDSNEEIDL